VITGDYLSSNWAKYLQKVAVEDAISIPNSGNMLLTREWSREWLIHNTWKGACMFQSRSTDQVSGRIQSISEDELAMETTCMLPSSLFNHGHIIQQQLM
jgi:hypothetical protein